LDPEDIKQVDAGEDGGCEGDLNPEGEDIQLTDTVEDSSCEGDLDSEDEDIKQVDAVDNGSCETGGLRTLAYGESGNSTLFAVC
jgi:hypothetical protein